MLNYKKILSTTGTAVLITSFASSGAFAASATGTASIDFYAPATVTSSTNMDFGIISTGGIAVGQYISLLTTGAYHATKTLTNISSSGTAAAFAVEVDGVATISVAEVDHADVALDNFKCKIGTGSEHNCGASTISADATVYVGARLTIENASVSGTVSPQYTMTVNYQ